MRTAAAAPIAGALLIAASLAGYAQPSQQPVQRTAEPAGWPRLDELRSAASASKAMMDAGQFLGASAKAKAVLGELGNWYSSPCVLDDTGQALSLALVNELKGRIEMAAGISVSVLMDRLWLYERVLQGRLPSMHPQAPRRFIDATQSC